MLSYVKTMPRSGKQAILLGLDLALAPVAFLLAAMLQFNSLLAPVWLGEVWPVLLVLIAATAILSPLLGLPRIQLKSYELSAMGRSALLAAALAAILGVTSQLFSTGLQPGGVITFALIFLFLTVMARLVLLQILLRLYRQDAQVSNVLIYGAGTTGAQLALALKAHDSLRVVAFVDDNKVLQGFRVSGLLVHSPHRLERLITQQGISRVLMAMPSLSAPRQARIARRVADLGVEVQSLPSFSQLVGTEQILDQLAPVLPAALLGRARLDSDLEGGSGAWAGKSVLISGAGGSIGSELCRQILNCRPRRLVLFELSEFALYSIHSELLALTEGAVCEVVPVLGNVTDPRQVRAALRDHQVQAVLHAAAYKHVPLVEANALAGLANNVLGTAALAQESHAHGVERFVLVSTDKAVRPVGVMGASKRLAELAVGDLAWRDLPAGPGPDSQPDSGLYPATHSGRGEGRDPKHSRETGTVFSTVRFGNVLGSSGSVIPLFREQIARGGPVTLTDPLATRYFMTVQEATRLVLRAGALARGGEIFVLDMGQPVKIADLARRMIEASGYTVRDAGNPQGDIDIVTIGLRPGEKLHEELSIGAALKPTAHPKIFQAEEARPSDFQIARALQSLRDAVAAGDADAARKSALHWIGQDLKVLQRREHG